MSGKLGFSEVRFEAACPTGLKGTPPHLDVLATDHTIVVGIESKCTEFLTPKSAEFSPSYDALVKEIAEPSWAQIYEELKKEPNAYVPLDAAQLVKHYLGLRKTYADHNVSLVYLFWEPLNKDEFCIFKTHRSAITRFQNATSSSSVSFSSLSYRELFSVWQRRGAPQWIGDHVRNLKGRYDVEV